MAAGLGQGVRNGRLYPGDDDFWFLFHPVWLGVQAGQRPCAKAAYLPRAIYNHGLTAAGALVYAQEVWF
ncbi:MAG: hypothetical protein BroJett015_37210 [Chloroflexota bacterium]|nr:MAG: hypothetical protein BroJett015_37210 [Chloroflexota bacterium]